MKKIGVVGHFVGPTTFGITKPYMSFLSHFGEVIIISPWDNEVRDLDLLVLPGGPDVDPLRYLEPGDEWNLNTGQPCMIRERFDHILLPQYINQRTPILGICRGHQSLYVQMGGKLIQHMNHESNGEDRSKLVHEIKFDNLELFPGIANFVKNKIGKKPYKVNSIHHQATDETSKPEIATVIARHSIDDTVEAITYWPNYPAHTFQWHPEEIWDNVSYILINHLLSLSDNENNSEETN